MKIEQIYTACLSQGAYYVRSGEEAIVIDPLREIAPYIERAKEDKVKIKYIFETHFHADFVSGHVTLAEKTGAEIIYGPNANPNYEVTIAKDEQVFELGDVKIKVLHTPGHTMESTTYLLIDENNEEHAIFTGDTLFIGDVGRPDLAQKDGVVDQFELAGILYDSLREKIMTLPDHVIVYPAHGAGSACGKSMMRETFDTLGNQKKVNYALRVDMNKEEFVKELTDGLLPPPNYFPLNVKLNKAGYDSIESVLEKGLKALSVKDFQSIQKSQSALVLDVRSQKEFCAAHIPNSIFIGLNSSFAPWVGELIVDVETPILIIAPEGQEEETVIRLARVGFDNTKGYLKGGITEWTAKGNALDSINSVDASELADQYEEVKNKIYDVRKIGEFNAQHIEDVHHVSLTNIKQKITSFPSDSTFYIHCAGGYRSVIAASILKSKGYNNLVNVKDGFEGILKTSIPKTSCSN